jgi:hypothetical protein
VPGQELVPGSPQDLAYQKRLQAGEWGSPGGGAMTTGLWRPPYPGATPQDVYGGGAATPPTGGMLERLIGLQPGTGTTLTTPGTIAAANQYGAQTPGGGAPAVPPTQQPFQASPWATAATPTAGGLSNPFQVMPGAGVPAGLQNQATAGIQNLQSMFGGGGGAAAAPAAQPFQASPWATTPRPAAPAGGGAPGAAGK